jgi:hypothetical protein
LAQNIKDDATLTGETASYIKRDMRKTLFLLILSLIVISCEKEHDGEIIEEEKFVSGDLNVGFKEITSLKSSFDLVNTFGLEITDVWGHHYISDLPNDSIDYVIKILKTKQYLNNDVWKVIKDGNVYNHYSSGKITVLCRMLNMGETNQKDWYKTVDELKLVEQPSVKVFYLKVPVGDEKVWRDRFRNQSMVKWAELYYVVEVNPWP